MKNVKLLVLAALMTSGVVAQTVQYREPTLRPISGNVVLNVWSWVPGLDKTVAEFEKRYPNVDVRVTNLGGGPATYTRLATAIQAGTGAPDVVQIEYGFLPSFIATDGLVDLRQYGANEVRNLFVPWTWGQVAPTGQEVFAIPQDTGPFAMVYRADLFRQYNIAVPRTWAEYRTAAERMNRASNGRVKLGNFYPGFAPWFMALAWADGAQFFRRDGANWTQTLNNASAKKVLGYWEDLVDRKLVSTYNAFTPDYWNAAGRGEIASNFEAAWGPGGYASSLGERGRGQWRVAPLPQWTAAQVANPRSGNWGGSSMAVTKQSRNAQAAATFAIWLNASRAAVEANFNGGGLFPAARAGLTLPALRNQASPPIRFFGGQDINRVYAQMSEGVNVNFQWAPWFTFANDNFNKHVDQMLKGQVTASQALDNWQRETLARARQDGYTVR